MNICNIEVIYVETGIDSKPVRLCSVSACPLFPLADYLSQTTYKFDPLLAKWGGGSAGKGDVCEVLVQGTGSMAEEKKRRLCS